MRAVRLLRPNTDLEDVEIEPAPPGPGDVLVQVKAAGICHSDVHYRNGPYTVDAFPMTPGHEVAGVVVDVGSEVDRTRVGERVCLHYQTSCRSCDVCARGHEQFCAAGKMLGKGFDGGYGEYVTIPSVNAFVLPEAISFEHGAVMMCSSATSLHAIRKGRLRRGEAVAVFGCGGLGMSAIQIARAEGAGRVFAVDLDPEKLAMAERLGAEPVDASVVDAPSFIRETSGGVDVALELVGSPEVARSAIDALGVMGRAVMVGISTDHISLAPFAELAPREAEVMGAMDHLSDEIPDLLDMALDRRLVLDEIVGATVPLDAGAINAVMDRMERFEGPVRTVIVP